ncbi:MAG TPA: hypothetical protein VG826_18340 [Pirellulales bacterium]|nr:hypothetical protein [Pirellulales bacterium]
MARHNDEPDGANDEPEHGVSPRDHDSSNTADYELTAKDAGWRTPTFLISPARLVVFDPPRPKRRP